MKGHLVLGHRVRPAMMSLAFVVLGVSAALVVTGPSPWWVLPLGILGPDLTFLAAAGQQPKAPGLMPPRAVLFYNAAHRPAVALGGLLLAFALAAPTAVALAVAWLSHIVWDRSVGYGLRNRHGAIVPTASSLWFNGMARLANPFQCGSRHDLKHNRSDSPSLPIATSTAEQTPPAGAVAP